MPRRPAPAAYPPPPQRLRTAACLVAALGFLLCIWKAMHSVPAPPPQTAGAPQTGAATPQEESPAIVIDPGHGGHQPGRVSGTEYEKKWALIVSLALAEELRRLGHRVELTRTSDTHVELPERAAFSNRAPRAAFVSIHFNAAESPDAHGIETFYAWPREPATLSRMETARAVPPGMALADDRSRVFAEHVQAAVCAATGARNRGAFNNPRYAVIRRVEAPAILVECGFLSNPAELTRILTDDYRARLVQGLASGIHSWIASGAGGPGAVHFIPASEAPPQPDASTPENP